jgi:general stress protein 26
MSATTTDDVKKLARLIEGIDFAMLTTVCEDGSLRSRPMSTQQAEFDGTLWFFTRDDTAKVGEIERDRQVNVSYAKPGDQKYVSVSGRATLLRDRAKIKELWNPAHKAWFPDGPDDPHLALLRVDVDKAEYWDSPSSTVMHVIGFVKALATGAEFHPGENKKLDL